MCWSSLNHCQTMERERKRKRQENDKVNVGWCRIYISDHFVWDFASVINFMMSWDPRDVCFFRFIKVCDVRGSFRVNSWFCCSQNIHLECHKRSEWSDKVSSHCRPLQQHQQITKTLFTIAQLTRISAQNDSFKWLNLSHPIKLLLRMIRSPASV